MAPHPAPVGWAPGPADRAEPTDGRHAFDRDAALTPIFTALRRGGRRRLRAQAGAPVLRLAPEPVERRPADPPTSPIPIVPPVHARDPYGATAVAPYGAGGHDDPYRAGGYDAAPVDPYVPGGRRGPIDPYAPASFVAAAPPASRNETTAVWHLSDDPTGYSPVTDTGRHHRRLAPAGW